MHKACIVHKTTQDMSAIRCPLVIENYHISILGLRKHFQICSSTGIKPFNTTNIEIFSQKRTTLTQGYCIAYQKTTPAKKVEG